MYLSLAYFFISPAALERAYLFDLFLSGVSYKMDVTDVLSGRRESGISAEDVIAGIEYVTSTGKRAADCEASAGSSDDEVSRGRVT
jgi:hypothetical protein